MGETKFYLISSGECPNQGPQCRHFQSKQGISFPGGDCTAANSPGGARLPQLPHADQSGIILIPKPENSRESPGNVFCFSVLSVQ